MISKLFINRPIVAMVIAIITVIGAWLRCGDCRWPSFRTSYRRRLLSHNLHGSGRGHNRTVCGYPARAADERRRRHALHAVDQRQ